MAGNMNIIMSCLLRSTSCFTDHSEWWNAVDTLDMFKTSSLLFHCASLFLLWPFIVVLWDTFSSCYEITLSGITGWRFTYLVVCVSSQVIIWCNIVSYRDEQQAVRQARSQACSASVLCYTCWLHSLKYMCHG